MLANYETPFSQISLNKAVIESPLNLAIPEIVGESSAAQHLRSQVRRLGPHFRTVLLRGEAGTGKELAARGLHGFSSHADGRFVIFDASARYSDISIGSVAERAHRGTLYIRQIGSLTSLAQTELLALLKSRERGRKPILVQGLEARIIGSTTEDLRGLVAAGRFLSELFVRVGSVEIELPPLRLRREDIPALAAHFVAGYARSFGKPVEGISAKVLEQLEKYNWPGNIAELTSLIRSGVRASRNGRIEAGDIAVPVEATRVGNEAELPSATARLHEVVERHVLEVLEQCAGNKVRAAELLGISRSTLYRMLEAG